MSEAKKNNEVKQESASLNPIPAEKRIMSWGLQYNAPARV